MWLEELGILKKIEETLCIKEMKKLFKFFRKSQGKIQILLKLTILLEKYGMRAEMAHLVQ
jgi:hypothetical protein